MDYTARLVGNSGQAGIFEGIAAQACPAVRFLIDETETMPSSSCYSTRLGSLVRAYTLIGWDPDRDFSYVEINRSIRRRHADLISAIFDESLALDATVSDAFAEGL